MTISNGSTILAADLGSLITSSVATIANDTKQLPLGGEISFVFPGITAALVASNPERCRAIFTAPYDLLLETLAVATGSMTAASTTTATLSCPGILDAFPVSVTGTTGTGITELARVLFDNVGKGVTRAVRCIPKGAIVQLDVSTTSVATASLVQVVIPYRQFFART